MANFTHAISTASTENATSYTTGAFTPAAGDLLVAIVEASNTTSVGEASSSTGGTFTRISGTSFDGTNITLLFVANFFASAVSQTFTWICPDDAATGTVIHIARLSGMSLYGASAVRQVGTNADLSSETPAVILGTAVLTGNPTI